MGTTNSHRSRRCSVSALVVGIATPAILYTIPIADIHVREAGRLPSAHGSVQQNCPVALTVKIRNKRQIFHRKVKLLASIRLIGDIPFSTIAQERLAIANDLCRGARVADELDVSTRNYKEWPPVVRLITHIGQRAAQIAVITKVQAGGVLRRAALNLVIVNIDLTGKDIVLASLKHYRLIFLVV